MNDQARWHEQQNRADNVYGNQGGPQYNNVGSMNQNTGLGTQYNSGGGSQYNGAGAQNYNAGGYQFNNNGSGTQHVTLERLRQLFKGALQSLDQEEYQQAVRLFREFIGTAEEDRAPSGAGQTTARAQVYLAVALLGGRRPSYHSTNEIREIEVPLARACEQGYDLEAGALARILLAIILEDFYQASDIPAGQLYAAQLYQRDAPRPRWQDELSAEDEELYRLRTQNCIDALSPGDRDRLASHTDAASSDTWKRLRDAAGHASAVVDTSEPRAADPRRAEKVRKYFTPTPQEVSQAWHVLLFCGAAALVVVGIASRSLFAIVAVAAAIWVAKKGYNQYKRYRAYRKKYEAAEPKPAESELDAWLRDDIEFIKRRGADRLQVRLHDDYAKSDLITKPLVVIGFPLPRDTRYGKLRLKEGKDSTTRADYYTVLIVFLTHRVVDTYRCVLDFATGEQLLDETSQIHWRSIAGVSSSSVPVSRKVEDLANLVLVSTGSQAQSFSSVHQFTLSILGAEPIEFPTMYSGAGFVASGGKVKWQDDNKKAMDNIQREVRARNAR
jgi:hypothetical protein